LAAKAARRKAVVADKQQAAVPAKYQLARAVVAAQSPIERCVVGTELFKSGMGTLILARRLPSGLLASSFILIDAYCLGVKDAFYREVAPSEFETLFKKQKLSQAFVDIDPCAARKLLRDVVAYAADLGFPPADDFAAAEKLFGSIDADLSEEVFVFGYEGKPLYVSGPYDTPAKIRRITETLDRRCGPNNWKYMIPLNEPPPWMLVDDRDDDDVIEGTVLDPE
jgi:hypothetical protein